MNVNGHPVILCKSKRCRARMIRAVLEHSGRLAMFNADPIGEQELRRIPERHVWGQRLYAIVDRSDDDLPALAQRVSAIDHEHGTALYRLHGPTCPESGLFRRRDR